MIKYAFNLVGKRITEEDNHYLNDLLREKDEQKLILRTQNKKLREYEERIHSLEAALSSCAKTKFFVEKDRNGNTRAIFIYSPECSQLSVIEVETAQKISFRKITKAEL